MFCFLVVFVAVLVLPPPSIYACTPFFCFLSCVPWCSSFYSSFLSGFRQDRRTDRQTERGRAIVLSGKTAVERCMVWYDVSPDSPGLLLRSRFAPFYLATLWLTHRDRFCVGSKRCGFIGSQASVQQQYLGSCCACFPHVKCRLLSLHDSYKEDPRPALRWLRGSTTKCT